MASSIQKIAIRALYFLPLTPRASWLPLNNTYVSPNISIVALIPIQQYFSWFDFLRLDEILDLWICWIRWWICESSPCHTSSVWPWLDMPKVPLYGTKGHLYGTYLGGLRHSPPWLKNQHGLNEEKNLIGKKIISQLSASDVTRVVSLDTNNQAEVYEESGELWEISFVSYNYLLILLIRRFVLLCNLSF